MSIEELESIAQAMVAPGKGIIAIDESNSTIKKRFDTVGVPNTEENRRAYREMLLTTPKLNEHISGAILYDYAYNANPASMRAALETLAALPARRRIAVLGDMLELGAAAEEHHAGLAAPIEAAKTDLVFAAGTSMKALWDKLPISRRGAYAANSAELAPKVIAALQPGDVVLVKGSNGSKLSIIIDALKARAGS